MPRKKFELSHSVFGLMALIALQTGLLYVLPPAINTWLVLLFAIAGSCITIFVATEVIEEVREFLRMFALLSVVVGEFVLFFAVQYGFLVHLSPGSFPTLLPDLVSLTLSSIMVFVFNPIYPPGDALGRMMLLIHTVSSLGLALFILQNITQFRRLASKKK
jgi:hypothetical protein